MVSTEFRVMLVEDNGKKFGIERSDIKEISVRRYFIILGLDIIINWKEADEGPTYRLSRYRPYR